MVFSVSWTALLSTNVRLPNKIPSADVCAKEFVWGSLSSFPHQSLDVRCHVGRSTLSLFSGSLGIEHLLLVLESRNLVAKNACNFGRKWRKQEAQAGIHATWMEILISTILL